MSLRQALEAMEAELAELKAHELAVAQAVGISYEAEGQASAPGPRDLVIDTIKRTQSDLVMMTDRATDNRSELDAAWRATGHVATADETLVDVIETMREELASALTARDENARALEMATAGRDAAELRARLAGEQAQILADQLDLTRIDAQRWRQATAVLSLTPEALGRAARGARYPAYSEEESSAMWSKVAVAVALTVVAALASDVAVEDLAKHLAGGDWDSWYHSTKEAHVRGARKAFAAQCKAAVGVAPEIGTAETFQAMNAKLRADLAAERQRAERAEKRHADAERLLADAREECRVIEGKRQELAVRAERLGERLDRSAKLMADCEEAAMHRGEARLAERLESEEARDAAWRALQLAVENGTTYGNAVDAALEAALAVARTKGEEAPPVAQDRCNDCKGALADEAEDPAGGFGAGKCAVCAAPLNEATAPAPAPRVEVGQRWKDPNGIPGVVRCLCVDGTWSIQRGSGAVTYMPHDATGWAKIDDPAAPVWKVDVSSVGPSDWMGETRILAAGLVEARERIEKLEAAIARGERET